MKFRLKTIIFLAAFSLTASGAFANISVICSMYPVYDFTRSITGNLADVKLLIRPGVEPHDYEPSPMEIKALNDSDVFIFTGKYMEQWAEKISSSLSETLIIDASENIALTDNDPHIWLDLSLAQKMVMNILTGLCSADSGNAENYRKNAEIYCSELQKIDDDFMNMKKNNSALVFAGEFSGGYFMRRYGFEYVSAYDGENEPSLRRMAEVMRYIREHGTRYIFADYGGVTQISRSISSETGADILTFWTGHNLPDDSVKFTDIMRENYRNIKEALHD